MYLPPLTTPTPRYHDGQTFDFDAGGATAPPGAASSPFGTPSAGDGVGSPWWSCGSAGANGNGASGGTLANLGNVLGALVSALQQLLGGLGAMQGTGNGVGNGYGTGNGGGTGTGYGFGGAPWTGPGSERFANLTISSTGDPHIAESGTTWGPSGQQTIDEHYDSMVAQPDLVSADVAGGYRVSTTVTQPNANGVTYNQSATVDADHGRDRVSMQSDGSFTVSQDGQSLALARGQTLTLAGGETVHENQNGSLLVNATNGRGGNIATTLSASGGGVNVSTSAQNLQLGGAVVTHPH
jgi:hypothetical protein